MFKKKLQKLFRCNCKPLVYNFAMTRRKLFILLINLRLNRVGHAAPLAVSQNYLLELCLRVHSPIVWTRTTTIWTSQSYIHNNNTYHESQPRNTFMLIQLASLRQGDSVMSTPNSLLAYFQLILILIYSVRSKL